MGGPVSKAACPDCRAELRAVVEAGKSEGRADCTRCAWTGKAKRVEGAGFVIHTKRGRWLGHVYPVRRT